MTTDGLNQSGFPISYRNEFYLSEDQGVQYFIQLLSNNEKNNIAIKWFDSQDRLISLFELNQFEGEIIRDYIGFEKKADTQIFFPEKEGEYSIYLYVNKQLKAVTKFEILK